jgi:hypothetical protein
VVKCSPISGAARKAACEPVFVVTELGKLQGHVIAGDVIAEASLSAQLKAAKPTPQ